MTHPQRPRQDDQRQDVLPPVGTRQNGQPVHDAHRPDSTCTVAGVGVLHNRNLMPAPAQVSNAGASARHAKAGMFLRYLPGPRPRQNYTLVRRQIQRARYSKGITTTSHGRMNAMPSIALAIPFANSSQVDESRQPTA